MAGRTAAARIIGPAWLWPLDEKRGIVYVPTGSAASDFYSADRLGDDLILDGKQRFPVAAVE
jgi:hypothetical protein